MNKNKSTNKKSSIFSGLARFSEFLYSKIPESLSAGLLTKRNAHQNGLFSKLISKLSFKSRVSLPVKRYISKSFDNSFILGYLKALINKIPSIQLKCVGFFYFSLGLFSTIVHLVKTDVLLGGAANTSLYLSVGAANRPLTRHPQPLPYQRAPTPAQGRSVRSPGQRVTRRPSSPTAASGLPYA